MTSSNQRSLIEIESNFGPDNYKPLPVVLSKGEGVWVWDVDNKKYLDMMSAYSAVSHGHSHPELLKVLHEQSARLALTSRAFYTDTLGPYLETITSVSNFDMALPMNSGAEAVETAIKASRRWAYRSKKIEPNKAEIIVADGNFHGRTTTIISFSSDANSKDDFGPHTPGFISVEFGSSKAIEEAMTENTAAVLVEPIQGEGGIIIPPDNWLAEIRDICTKHGVLMILDEVQSGLGRTGKMFAFEHYGIKPDIMTLAKGLGGGVPIGAVLANEKAAVFQPGDHGSTFGGNVLACAASAFRTRSSAVARRLDASSAASATRFAASSAAAFSAAAFSAATFSAAVFSVA